MHRPTSPASIRIGDPLRRAFLDELRQRVPLPRPLALEWAMADAELLIVVAGGDEPWLGLAGGPRAGKRRWAMRQRLDDLEAGDVFDLWCEELSSGHGDPEIVADWAFEATEEFLGAVADTLETVTQLRPEHAALLRGLARAVREGLHLVPAPPGSPDSGADHTAPEGTGAEIDSGPDVATSPGTGQTVPVTPPGATSTVKALARPPVERARSRHLWPRVLRVLVVVALVALVVAAVAAATARTASEPATSPEPGAAPPAEVADFEVKFTNVDGSPVRLDPCHTYPYVVQPGSLDRAAAAAEVGAAFAALEEASGVGFRFTGFTDERFPHPVPASPRAPSPVLVSYERPQESEALREAAHVHGLADRVPLGGLALADPVEARPGVGVLAGGDVVLNEEVDADRRVRVLLHELGHLAGLDHAGDPAQLMAPAVPHDGAAAYRDGDRAGLAAVGAAGGCVLTEDERSRLLP